MLRLCPDLSSTASLEVLKREIFGPIIPILSVSGVEEVPAGIIWDPYLTVRWTGGAGVGQDVKFGRP